MRMSPSLDLLDIAKLESGRLMSVPERLVLPALTSSIVSEMEPRLITKGRTRWTCASIRRRIRCIAIDVEQHNGSITWAVCDNGVGVPRAALPKLFEKFYRADNAVSIEAEGTGPGLHLVRLIVEQAGRVWCESEEGRGATFAFTLPTIVEQGDRR
ncbi:MAG: hypothetical protein DMF86_14965 [Acidobacteria bacterium]|nr:MAG: hypothetical protein DMF86_14965 [Acidobacteriota bacterium]